MFKVFKFEDELYTADEVMQLGLSSTDLIMQVTSEGETFRWLHFDDPLIQAQLSEELGYSVNDDGVVHRNNINTNIDKSLLKKAYRGDKFAQYDVGFAYYHHNNEEALKWFMRSAYQGYPPAQNILGIMFCNGEGVAKDAEEGLRWYEKAARQNDIDGKYNAAGCYYRGDGCKKDLQKALTSYLSVPENHLRVDDLRAIALMYEEGVSSAPNIEKSLQFFKKAALRGDIDSNKDVARLEKLFDILCSPDTQNSKFYQIADYYYKIKNYENTIWMRRIK